MINPGVITQGAVTAGNAAVFVNRNMIKDGGVAPTVAGLLGWIDVYSYLTPAEKIDVGTWQGNLDVTASVQNAVAALNSGGIGGVLYFRPGEWQINATLTITVPVHIMGCGMAATDGGGNIATRGITQIVTVTANLTVFSVSSTNTIYGLASNISIANVSGAQTSGSAILVDSTDANTRFDFENVQCSNFFIGVDSKVNQAWHMRGCYIEKFTSLGLKVRNTVNADAGDWEVSGNVFLAKNGALSAIDIESSGGGRILSNKCNVVNGAFAVDGIRVNVSASKQLQIIGNNAENVTGSPLNVIAGFSEILVLGNNFNANQGTNPAITATGAGKFTSGYNILTGSTGPAISLNTCTNVLIGPEMFEGFTSNVSLTSCSGVSDWTPTGSIATGSLNVATGTITASTPVLSGTQTWNAGGVTFNGELVNITDTASAAASRLYAGQVSSVDKFYARKDGLVFGVRFTTNPGLSAVLPSVGLITTSLYVTAAASPLGMVLAGGATYDGVISTTSGGAETFALGVTSNDNTFATKALIWDATGNITVAAYIEGTEQTAPSAPAANGYRIFAQDNGAGKTQLMVIFNTGAAQQIAIQP